MQGAIDRWFEGRRGEGGGGEGRRVEGRGEGGGGGRYTSDGEVRVHEAKFLHPKNAIRLKVGQTKVQRPRMFT